MSNDIGEILKCAIELRKEYSEINPLGSICVCLVSRLLNQRIEIIKKLIELEKEAKKLKIPQGKKYEC